MDLQSSINKENLIVLMGLFYAKAINDEELSDFFVDELGDDLENEEWVDHIDTLANFWLAKILDEDTYGGNYVGRHYGVPHISRQSFMKWIELFSETADEVYVADISAIVKKKSILLSEEFMQDLMI